MRCGKLKFTFLYRSSVPEKSSGNKPWLVSIINWGVSVLVALERPRGAFLPWLKVGRKIPFLVPPYFYGGSPVGFFNHIIISTQSFMQSHNPNGYFWHSAFPASQILPHFSLKSQIPPFKKGKFRIPKNILGSLSMVIMFVECFAYIYFSNYPR